ncbi:MAG TPA: M48 family metalloprotease [Terriglobales bacterium]|nr:M48 family metalloprotease [Terriglobales bacterium]
MRFAKWIMAAALACCCGAFAQDQPQAAAPAAPVTMDQVVDHVVASEQKLVMYLDSYSPVVETYFQAMKPDPELGMVPAGDKYFLGRLDLMHASEASYLGSSSRLKRFLGTLTETYSLRLNPAGFAWMIYADRDEFDRQHYDFRYVRREFLGDLRCLVFDVQPKPKTGDGRFIGRIWVEDQGYNVVRLNGTYSNKGNGKYYFHFDSWRLNLQPGLWLPSYVYSEESDMHYGIGRATSFKAQTRLWGYNLKHASHQSELTQLTVDSPDVQDQSAAAQDATPVQSQRLWEQQAEGNVVERLQQAGLLAPRGEVDTVLETVVNNLVVTNNINLTWPVHCRVMLTEPLETFHVGHTIVISRGLLDVLPDEASLATVLSHELGHIVLGHQTDTKFAFVDRMLFSDQYTYQQLGFAHNLNDEASADKKALELLQNSPYKAKLASAGLFLKALQERSVVLSALLTPHLGNPLASRDRVLRMPDLMSSAPALEMSKLDQVPALPLGGRVKVDPWSDQAELVKSPSVPLASAREKMIFEVTPVFPHLARESAVGAANLPPPSPAQPGARAAAGPQQPDTTPPPSGASPQPAGATPQAPATNPQP